MAIKKIKIGNVEHELQTTIANIDGLQSELDNNWNAAKTHADSAHAPSDAQPNQNAFSNIKVGSTTIAADTTTDTLTLAGTNVTITPDATNDKVTFSVADASTSAKGVVQLTDSITSDSTTTAATASSVRSVYRQVDARCTEMEAYMAGKADYDHKHSTSDITGLSASLALRVPITRTINGKALSSDITLTAEDIGISGGGSDSDAMSKTNPTGTGSLSINRLSGSTIGTNSVAIGTSTTASGNYSYAEGHSATAKGERSHAEGSSSKCAESAMQEYGKTLEEATDLEYITDVWYDLGDDVGFSLAYGKASHVEGGDNLAFGDYSHAEGYYTEASGYNSHAEGYQTTASGNYSHAEGGKTSALGVGSHAEGASVTASGNYSHAEGRSTEASGFNSHAEGGSTDASGYCSHAEGYYATASGDYSHAEGRSTNSALSRIEITDSTTNDEIESAWTANKFSLANGEASHVEGRDNLALGDNSHAEGQYTDASGNYSHAEGGATVAVGLAAHASGANTTAVGNYSYAGGGSSKSLRSLLSDGETLASFKGSDTITDVNVITKWNNSGKDFSLARGNCSHVEGLNNLAIGEVSHAEGYRNLTQGDYSHAEGYGTTASNEASHAEGYYTTASGRHSHAEGASSEASGNYSHAEGYNTTVSGNCSHAEGSGHSVSGNYSHAEGYHHIIYAGTDDAPISFCHAEGRENTVYGELAHVEGYKNEAHNCQHVQGHFNNSGVGIGGATGTTGVAFIIGNGTQTKRSNAFRVNYNGDVYTCQNGTYNTSGADYAEFFEWQDLNANAEDRRGYFVTLDGEKIKIAEPNDYILGIVSSTPAVIGNSDEDWLGRYVLDEFGSAISEEFEYEEEVPEEVIDEETGEITIETRTVTKTGTRLKQNPDYDPTLPYVQREDRPEWATVGMMGVIHVRDDGTCQVNGYCTVAEGGIATASETGYRVINRVNDNIIKVVFK